jgi:hypothetical protein
MAKKQKLVVKGTVVTVEYPTINKSVSIDYDKLSAEMKLASGLHGLGQRLGDAASGEQPADKFAMASRLVESITGGSWELGTREVDLTTIVAAVAKASKKTAKAIVAVLEALDEDARKKKVSEWRAAPAVKLELIALTEARLREAVKDADEFKV